MAITVRLLPAKRMTTETSDCAKPESSMTLPKTAPSKNTGKYNLTKYTAFSMYRPVKMVGTLDGCVNRTGIIAASGANRITLKPR
jgi:hypothetical protein